MSKADASKNASERTAGEVDAVNPLAPESLAPLMLGLGEIHPEPAANASLKARILQRARNEGRSNAGEPEGTTTIRADGGEWVAVAPGVHMKRLHRDGEARTFLLKIDPGGTLPGHRHEGDEECIVLEGEAFLGDERVSVGDYHLAPRGTQHGALTSRTGALLFLRSAAAAAPA